MLIIKNEGAVALQSKPAVNERKSQWKLSKLKTGNRIIDHFKTHYWKDAEFTGKFQFLKLEPISLKELPNENNVITFSEMFSSKYRNHLKDYWIDFFNDDIVIERFWKYPEKYLPMLKEAKGVICTDYSVMTGLLFTDNINNVQRNHITTYLIAREGITAIPVASWTDKDSYSWCFDGLPHHSVIAISSNGCLKGDCINGRKKFVDGVFELNRRKHPATILISGPRLKELDSLPNIRYYKSYQQRLNERLHYGQ